MIFYLDIDSYKTFLKILLPLKKDAELEEEELAFKELGDLIRRHCKVIPLYDYVKDINRSISPNVENTEERWLNEKNDFLSNENLKVALGEDFQRHALWNIDSNSSTNQYEQLESEEFETLLSVAFFDDNIKKRLPTEVWEKVNTLINPVRYGISIKTFLRNLLIKGKAYPSKSIGSDEKKWDDLIGPALPCSDIIIVDKYFIKKEENNSVKKLLDLLLRSQKKEVNIIVFCKPVLTSYIDSKELDSAKDLYDYVAKKGHKLTFVTHFFDYVERNANKGLHDRYILCNYKFFLCGHSFSQMFNNEEGENTAKGSVWFVPNTYIDYSNRKLVESIISNKLAPLVESCNSRKLHEIFGNANNKVLNITEAEEFESWYKWNSSFKGRIDINRFDDLHWEDYCSISETSKDKKRNCRKGDTIFITQIEENHNFNNPNKEDEFGNIIHGSKYPFFVKDFKKCR